VIIYKLLAESGKIFGSLNSTIPNAMNGLPRISLGSEFNLLVWLTVIFGPFWAIVINYILVRFIAFFSMYIFLNNWLTKNDSDKKYP